MKILTNIEMCGSIARTDVASVPEITWSKTPSFVRRCWVEILATLMVVALVAACLFWLIRFGTVEDWIINANAFAAGFVPTAFMCLLALRK